MKYHQEYLDSIKILEEKWKVHQQSPKKEVHLSMFRSAVPIDYFVSCVFIFKHMLL
jgi:predicted DNA-binding ArsR family transcriptional regulator